MVGSGLLWVSIVRNHLPVPEVNENDYELEVREDFVTKFAT